MHASKERVQRAKATVRKAVHNDARARAICQLGKRINKLIGALLLLTVSVQEIPPVNCLHHNRGTGAQFGVWQCILGYVAHLAIHPAKYEYNWRTGYVVCGPVDLEGALDLLKVDSAVCRIRRHGSWNPRYSNRTHVATEETWSQDRGGTHVESGGSHVERGKHVERGATHGERDLARLFVRCIPVFDRSSAALVALTGAAWSCLCLWHRHRHGRRGWRCCRGLVHIPQKHTAIFAASVEALSALHVQCRPIRCSAQYPSAHKHWLMNLAGAQGVSSRPPPAMSPGLRLQPAERSHPCQ